MSSAGRRRVVDVGGGFGVRQVLEEPEPPVEQLVREVVEAVAREWAAREPAAPRASSSSPAVRSSGRRRSASIASARSSSPAIASWVAIDGGMSDNPRPQLYGARYSALLANRADEDGRRRVRVAGKHCESGDVLIERVRLPEPRRGDLLAVPATGAYTLAMSSNYNGVPRPAAVLVADGDARLILRRETVEDLLAREV